MTRPAEEVTVRMAVVQSRFKDVGTAAFYAASALGIVTLLLTSGVNANFLNAAIDAAEGGTADADDYFAVANVAVAAAPLVVAIVVSFFVTIAERLEPMHRVGLIAFVWLTAGVISTLVAGAGFDMVGQTYESTPGGVWFVRFFLTGVLLVLSPYSLLLIVQACVVAGGFLGAWMWLSEKWTKKPAAPAA